MSKFIDLADEIMAEVPNDLDPLAVRTLRWLDEHPERVPGRTITEGDLESVNEALSPGLSFDPWILQEIAEALGIVVVPDPEPTNAELLRELMGMAPSSLNRGQLADWLDSRGVKAPGDDDE